ncbi:hypothetical protein EJ06DRAFT_529210 [Trichodelitschia bisporula]|uniref:Uncharacterized protein n=1 Tax=Trichodelitschia bisporula TaxID=703511 RepID=A0A6G1I1H0_9PEZI|nr:hypothetical protein EJ06DRAFT_529210 [Trichodelitschia bisporula]
MWLLECTLSALGLLNQLSLRPQVYKCYAPVKVYSHSSQSINLNSNNHTSKKMAKDMSDSASKWSMVTLDTIIKYLMFSKERQACLAQSRPTPKAVDSDELRAERLKEQEEIFEYLCTSG